MAEKNKKSVLRPGCRDRLWANVSNSRGFSSSHPSTGERAMDSVNRNYVAHISDFIK